MLYLRRRAINHKGIADMDTIEVVRDEMGNYVERAFVYVPTEWQKQGLQQTATGYGSKLNTGYKVAYFGKVRRVYAVCYSNVASLYVMFNGQRRFLGV